MLFRSFLKRAIAEVQGALEADIEKVGGLENLVIASDPGLNFENIDDVRKVEILTPDQIHANLKKTNLVISTLENRQMKAFDQVELQAQEYIQEQVESTNAVGVAFNEYMLVSIATSFVRQNKQACTDWLSLGVVRGRACYWSRIDSPDLLLSGDDNRLKVEGGARVDVGGSLEGCVKKFWDWSWDWACSQIRMGVKGRPGVEIDILRGKYIAFTGKLVGKLRLETNLPFPFNKIINAVSEIIWSVVKAIITILLKHIKIGRASCRERVSSPV